MIGWPTVPLGELCQIELGGTPPRSSPRFWDEGRTTSNVWLSIADLPMAVNAVVSDSKEYLSDEGAARGKIVKAGTLLVSFKLTLGRLAFAGCDLRTNEAIAALSIREAKRVSKEYLYWFLTYFDWDKAAEGEDKVKGKTLNKAKLKELPVLLPCPEEQRRIVAVLDEAFAAIATATANTEKNLANAREILLDKIELELNSGGPGWIETTMEVICSRFEYGTSAKSQPTGSVPVLRMGNLQNGEIDWSDLVYTDDVEDIRQLSLRPMDVLFNRTNSLEHVGKTAIVRDGTPAIFAGYLIRLHYRPDAVDPDYLNLYLNSRSVRAYGRALAGKSVNQANISAGKLKTYPVRLPPLADQKSIVSTVSELRDDLERLQAVQSAKIGKLTALKQALLHRAFTGELTATMPETIAA